MAKRILVPVDGSPQSVAALRFATEEWPDADFVLLNVIDPVASGAKRSVLPTAAEEWYNDAREAARETFAELTAEMEIDPDTVITVGRPASSIVEAAADADHVVMGSHGRTGVSRIILGSVAEDVVRRSPVPVTIVR
jgi:nucleotide-binding universal stress UspA family protein